MTLFHAVALHTLVAGLAGLAAMMHIAAWKLSTESIDSSRPITRWVYRYLVFSFWFFFSFFVAPLTTWQLTELPAMDTFARNHPSVLLLLTAVPATLFYYLYRKYIIWCDPVKIRARKKGSKLLFRAGP